MIPRKRRRAEGAETNVDIGAAVEADYGLTPMPEVESDDFTAESSDGAQPSSLRMFKSGKRPAEDPPDGELQRPSRPPPAYSVPDEGGGAAEGEQTEEVEESVADEVFFTLMRQIRQTEKGRQASDKFVQRYLSRSS